MTTDQNNYRSYYAPNTSMRTDQQTIDSSNSIRNDTSPKTEHNNSRPYHAPNISMRTEHPVIKEIVNAMIRSQQATNHNDLMNRHDNICSFPTTIHSHQTIRGLISLIKSNKTP